MILETFIIILYSSSVLIIFVFSLCQLNLLINYLRAKKREQQELLYFNELAEFPCVTVQLPVFNEKYVMPRLLNNIAQLDYPPEKLQIQVLDDSTDESLITTKQHIQHLQQSGLNIQHVTRDNREGFKAGALKHGLELANGEFIAIFDADFLPSSDWLKRTVPYFTDEQIGVVQTRWSHINKNYSLLTKIQAFALDAHFTLEQVGRNSRGHFINFNGTAGIWRKACIEDAGNWQGDTLTEDLDLSYRAQLKKWKFKYLEHVETPAELPVAMSAARSQQFRWNKGGAENFQKMRSKLLNPNNNLSLGTKYHSLFHLLSSTMFLNVFIVACLSIPMLYIKNTYTHLHLYFYGMSFFVLSSVIFFVCYWQMFKRVNGGGSKQFVRYTAMFFTFFSVAMGFSLHNSIAVIQGHLGKRSEFIRTPKFNVRSFQDAWKDNVYLKYRLSKTVLVEGLLMLYFAFGMYSAFIVGESGDFGLFPFHLMLFSGFAFVFFKSVLARPH